MQEILYTQSGSYTFVVPQYVNTLYIECWGAGGGGAGRWFDGTFAVGGSGGAGGYIWCGPLPVTPGTAINLYVGQRGGPGADISGDHGTDGQDTWFSGSTYLYADGGQGGQGRPGGFGTPAGGTGGGANGPLVISQGYSGGGGVVNGSGGGISVEPPFGVFNPTGAGVNGGFNSGPLNAAATGYGGGGGSNIGAGVAFGGTGRIKIAYMPETNFIVESPNGRAVVSSPSGRPMLVNRGFGSL